MGGPVWRSCRSFECCNKKNRRSPNMAMHLGVLSKSGDIHSMFFNVHPRVFFRNEDPSAPAVGKRVVWAAQAPIAKSLPLYRIWATRKVTPNSGDGLVSCTCPLVTPPIGQMRSAHQTNGSGLYSGASPKSWPSQTFLLIPRPKNHGGYGLVQIRGMLEATQLPA